MEAGYTLTETLAALVVLALAISGLAAAAATLGQGQSVVNVQVADVAAVRAGQVALDRLLEGHGPFRSHEPEALSGDAAGFRLACGEPAPCSVQVDQAADGLRLRIRRAAGERMLRLRAPGPGRFVYEGREAGLGAWPPEPGARQALRSVSLVRGQAGAEETLLISRVWREQPVACEFDVLLQDCR